MVFKIKTLVILMLFLASCINSYAMMTPLHEAVDRGDVDQVKTLLDQSKDDLNANSFRGTPLKLAVQGGRAAIVRLLLQTPGIDISECFKNEASLKVVEEFHPLFCKIPQKLKMPIKCYDETLLHDAVGRGEPAVLHDLLQIPGIDANVHGHLFGETPIQRAARQKNPLFLEEFLQIPGMITEHNINTPTTHGDTVLHLAANASNLAGVRSLLRIPGINVNAVDVYGHTPVEYCVNAAVLQELLPLSDVNAIHRALQNHYLCFNSDLARIIKNHFGKKVLSLAMGLHPRLGKDSPVRHLLFDGHILKTIYDVLILKDDPAYRPSSNH